MRYYSSIAQDTTLTTAVNSTDTAFIVASVSGYPASYPYTIVVGPDTASEELVTVTALSGLTFTVTRGADGTTGVAHPVGSVVKHAVSARDYTETQAHIAATTAVHGVAVALVGTTDARLSDARTPVAHVHAQADVTSLTANLALKAPIAAPTFTGLVTVVSPTATGSIGVRQVTMSTVAPSAGADGDVWLVYV